VTAADVFEFLADLRGGRTAVRLADRESGLSGRTIARCLLSGLYAYLVAQGDTLVRPTRCRRACRPGGRRNPQVRTGGYGYAAAECGAAS
jgi:hypothetical protein